METEDQLTDERALALANQMAVIPGFPSWAPAACAAIAIELMDLCKTEALATKLVKHAIANFPKWEGLGIPAMRAILESMQSKGSSPSYPLVIPACPDCSDTGAVLSQDRWVACTCPASAPEHVIRLNEQMDKRRKTKANGLQPVGAIAGSVAAKIVRGGKE